ncbi:MAG: DUF58 domain-containing protein [Myxococcota bacterium]
MTRPTTEGWLAAVGALALGAVALWSGNNALLLIGAPIWAVLGLAGGLGALNVRGLAIERRWPAELVAGRAGRGALIVSRHRGASHALVVTDDVAEPVDIDAVRGQRTLTCRWRFPERGPATVTGFGVVSTWPFGLFRHTSRIDAPDEVLVGVRPHPAGLEGVLQIGDGRTGSRGRSGTGELVGLRPYVPGDPLRRVHWPTSARAGLPIVVERTEDESHAVVVGIEVQDGAARWERELSRAAGQIQRAARQGLRVGLTVPAIGDAEAAHHPPRLGAEGWRRHLLDVLARLPRMAP